MFRHIIPLLLSCCISFNAFAQEVILNKNHPDKHVVVKGDTLWDISAKFLKDPWLWPKVWNLNRTEIKNPHLIYPGDVIVLDMSSGSPRFKLLRENIANMDPKVVIEPLEKNAIPTIALNVIAPFLSHPLVIEQDQLKNSPRIIAGQDNRVILSPGTRIYVRDIPVETNLNWNIYRQSEALTDPETKQILGYEATYLGDAKVTKWGDPVTATITKAKEEIFVHDRLMPYSEHIITNFVPRAPETQINGRIMTIYGGVGEAGVGSIVTINRGSAQGIESGHVLAVKNFGRSVKDTELAKRKEYSFKNEIKGIKTDMVKLPDERAGLLMIFRVFNNVSYGLIMQTEQPVNELDAVTTP